MAAGRVREGCKRLPGERSMETDGLGVRGSVQQPGAGRRELYRGAVLHSGGPDGVPEADNRQRATDRRGGFPGVREEPARGHAEGEKPDHPGGAAEGER